MGTGNSQGSNRMVGGYHPSQEVISNALSLFILEKLDLTIGISKPSGLTPFAPRVSYGFIKVILSSEPVDEILWCDHSNETSSVVLPHGTIYI